MATWQNDCIFLSSDIAPQGWVKDEEIFTFIYSLGLVKAEPSDEDRCIDIHHILDG
jgi:hypothetical protein